jgi:hypothetical protein
VNHYFFDGKKVTTAESIPTIKEEQRSLDDLLSQIGDHINHPTHYNQGKIEVIDAIEDWKLGFNLGNVVKYIARAGKKDQNKRLIDLKKALWYLEREISNEEKESKKT